MSSIADRAPLHHSSSRAHAGREVKKAGRMKGCRSFACTHSPCRDECPDLDSVVPTGLEIGDRLVRRVVPRRAHHAATRPGTGTAKVQPADRSFVGRRAGHGTEIERLLRDELALEYVSAGQ